MSFGFVVIESFDEDFELEMGGKNYLFEKGRKYIPIFYCYHSARIKNKKGLKIFFGPGYFDDFNDIDYYEFTKKYVDKTILNLNLNLSVDIKGGNLLWYFILNFMVIYKNFNLKKNEMAPVNNHLLMCSGLYDCINVSTKFISIEDFYSDYINKANGSEDVIYFIDEFIQYDIMKIVEKKDYYIY